MVIHMNKVEQKIEKKSVVVESLEGVTMRVLNETMESTIESPMIYDPEERFKIYKKYYEIVKGHEMDMRAPFDFSSLETYEQQLGLNRKFTVSLGEYIAKRLKSSRF